VKEEHRSELEAENLMRDTILCRIHEGDEKHFVTYDPHPTRTSRFEKYATWTADDLNEIK